MIQTIEVLCIWMIMVAFLLAGAETPNLITAIWAVAIAVALLVIAFSILTRPSIKKGIRKW